MLVEHHGEYVSPFQILALTDEDCRAHIAELDATAEQISSDRQALWLEIVTAHKPFANLTNSDDHFLAVANSVVRARMADAEQRQEYWPLICCSAALRYFKNLQQHQSNALSERAVKLAMFAQFMMCVAWQPKRVREALELGAKSKELAEQTHDTNGMLQTINKALVPLAEKGIKFKTGRPKGSLKPTARRISKHLLKHPNATPLEVWGALSAKPEKNTVYRHAPQVGRYIEAEDSGQTIMGWRRFSNLVSAHRPKEK